MDLGKLKEPFSEEDIEWRIQQSGVKNGKPWAIILAYVTNRAIMNRLDEVCGQEFWWNQFQTGPDGGVLCGITISTGNVTGDVVTKWDGAPNTDVESIKGGLSGAMKRAAVQWGIGRYLYSLGTSFANIHEGGRLRGSAKADGKPVYFKWDPPELPEQALPKGEKPKKAKKTATKKTTSKAATPKDAPATKKQRDELAKLSEHPAVERLQDRIIAWVKDEDLTNNKAEKGLTWARKVVKEYRA
jgi:hypothetical protein